MFIINTNFDLKAPSFNFSRDYFANIDELNAVKKSWNDWFPTHFITNVGGTLYQFDGTKFNEFLKAGGNYVSTSVYNTDKAAIEKKIKANADNINSLADRKADNIEASTTAAGLMSAKDKAKLDGIAEGANKYVLPKATDATLGGIMIGGKVSGKNYPVQLDSSGSAYVNVPWTDSNTTYNDMTGATASAAGTHGLVPAPAAGKQTSFLRGDGTWVVPTDTNTTYTFANGLNGTFTVTPSGGTAQTVNIGKPSTAGRADKAFSADSATIAETLKIPANKAETGNAIVIGTYAPGASLSGGGGIGPGTFTPTETMVADSDGFFGIAAASAKSAVTADCVGSPLTIKSLTTTGTLEDKGTSYDGHEPVSLEAITFEEINGLINS